MKFYEYILFIFQILLLLATIGCNNSNADEQNTIIPENETIQTDTTNSTDTTEAINYEETDPDRYEDSILQSMGMVRIDDSLPNVIIDIKYATNDNFVGIDFYNGFKHAYVQPECLKKLQKALILLQQKDSTLTFVIFDAARSIESQQLMWDSVNVPGYSKINFVADPQKGSIHNYGMALDIGVADNDGNYLDMGTKFDYFGELAYPRYTEHYHSIDELSDEQYKNRTMLMEIMKQAGFYISRTEWWHYNASSLDRAKSTYNIYKLK